MKNILKLAMTATLISLVGCADPGPTKEEQLAAARDTLIAEQQILDNLEAELEERDEYYRKIFLDVEIGKLENQITLLETQNEIEWNSEVYTMINKLGDEVIELKASGLLQWHQTDEKSINLLLEIKKQRLVVQQAKDRRDELMGN